MTASTNRRDALRSLGVGLAAAGWAGAAAAAPAAQANPADATPSLQPQGAATLHALTAALARAPRRRAFKTVPMILDHPDQWDAEALDAVLAYRGTAKQAWDNTDLHGPWLNLMRNAMNAQIWSFRHANFLCVSATHGLAHLALYDQAMWDKYQLAKMAGNGVTANRFIDMPAAAAHDPKDFEAADGAFSPKDNSITALQRRGAVFLACHNAIWELAERLAAGANPDHARTDAVAAELTNHLVPGVVLTPGAVGTTVELHRAGFAYSR
ncbi:MAG: transcriptional initiation protein Tat [Acetobacteraceae bacterium]|nr:transcriptional initiation protein Tat [Acetobacteraceae bacterium]